MIRVWLRLRSLVLLILAVAALPVDAKPFRRVLVMTGGSLEFATHLGVWMGVQEAGWKPDLVITTCGSSMVTAFIQAEPNPRAVRDAMMSREFFEELRAAAVVDNDSGLKTLIRVYFEDNRSEFPQVFGRTILDVPMASPIASLNKDFDSRRPRVLMLASKFAHGPEAQGKKWSELGEPSIQEVFFTDHDTASRIPRFTSPLAALSPRIARETRAIGGWDVWEAMRASISDPYLLSPVRMGNDYYATGAVDLVPVELALALGDDVLITYTGRMGEANSRGFENLFGFSQNKRGFATRSMDAENLRWIDLSDDTKVYRKHGISPELPPYRSMIPIPGFFLRIKDRMPKTYAEFAEKTEAQFEFGSSRAMEALTKSAGDRSYIRNPWKK